MALGPLRNAISSLAATLHLRLWADRRHERDVGLYLVRERADELDAGCSQNLGDDRHPEFHVSFRDELETISESGRVTLDLMASLIPRRWSKPSR